MANGLLSSLVTLSKNKKQMSIPNGRTENQEFSREGKKDQEFLLDKISSLEKMIRGVYEKNESPPKKNIRITQ